MSQEAVVKVYDKTGVTLLATFERVWDVRWKDELNGAGWAEFTIHTQDVQATQALLGDWLVVKMAYTQAGTTQRFGMVITERRRRIVTKGPDERRGEIITVSGPGVAALLGSAVIFPEYGTLRRSNDSRAFNYGSIASEWYVGSEWAAPVATASGSDARTAEVADWPTAAASWIWPVIDGSADVPMGTVGFFRKPFTLTEDTDCVGFATADDGLELKLDAETQIPMSSADSRTFKVTKRFEVTLGAGDHMVAARVDNQNAFDSPAGLLFALHKLNTDGTPGDLIIASDAAWESRPGPTVPGWRKSQVFRKAFTEARDTYGVEGMSALTVGFTATHDSDSVVWSDPVGTDRSFPVGMSVLDLLTQLSEVGSFDWRVGPDMVIEAWNHKGAASGVTLVKAGNLLGYETQSQALTATRLLVRTRDGWLNVGDAGTAEATYGTHFDFLSLGDVEDDTTATAIAETTLSTYAVPQAAYTAEVAVLPDAVPYVDYEVGDTVTAPGEWGGTVTLRVRALTMVMDDNGRMRPVPEFLAA